MNGDGNDNGNDDDRMHEGDFIIFDFDVDANAIAADFFDIVAIVVVKDDDDDDDTDNDDVSDAATAAVDDDDVNDDANKGSNINSIDCTKAGLFNDVDKL